MAGRRTGRGRAGGAGRADRTGPSGRGRRAGAGGLEWIGGRLTPPFFVDDCEEPFRAELVLWLEAPSGLAVGQQVLAPEQVPGAVGRVLRESLERPLAGLPRRPARIRVADAALAAEVREAVGEAIPVTVAPTPELDAVLAQMVEDLSGEDGVGPSYPSYLEGGRIAAGAVARLFEAARLLYLLKPWETATDDRVLRMDIPALGVDGACVSIIGNLGESLGVIVFPSLEAYEAFGEAVEPARLGRGRLDFGTDWLALCFERGADLPASLRREVEAHGWSVADADAYPWLERHDRDGTPRPLVARDVALATACAASLTAFFARNESAFAVDDPEPVCESWFDEDDLEVRFTLPYEAYGHFEVGGEAPRPAAPARARVGRNDPCPCGSGRKYKKCCLARDEAARAARAAPAAEHDLDQELAAALLAFAERRWGADWGRYEESFEDVDAAAQLAIPWAVYHHRVDGATACEQYLAERGASLGPRERSWLAAQQRAWLSVWEVTDAVPGESLALRDLLSGETRRVREVSGSRSVVARDAFLGRVVDGESGPLLCGAHPRPLPPREAAEVVRRARGRLRRRREVPVERLRDEAFGRYLIRRWEEAVDELDLERELLRAFPPQLQNTDGEPFLLTTDHFAIAPGEAAAVEAVLAAMPGAEPPDPDEDPPAYVFLREGNAMHASWEHTVVGRAWLEGDALRVETNSRERADALRARLETACGERIRHRAREHSDPLSERAPARSTPAGRAPAEPPPPEVQAALLELKQRHYEAWLDQPVPALDDSTPREAVRTVGGRAAVDVLLKEMENREQRLPSGEPFDFGELRRALRLE